MPHRVLRVALLTLLLMLLLSQVSGAQTAKPAFTESDRAAINVYFKNIHANTAPGSIDRTDLPLAVEQSLAPGGRVPLQYEKRLQRIPEALRSQLSLISGDYEYYLLAKHVLLARKGTLEVSDIVRNAGYK